MQYHHGMMLWYSAIKKPTAQTHDKQAIYGLTSVCTAVKPPCIWSCWSTSYLILYGILRHLSGGTWNTSWARKREESTVFSFLLRREYSIKYCSWLTNVYTHRRLHTSLTCLLDAKICINLGLQPRPVSGTANSCLHMAGAEHSQWQLLNSGMNYHLNWELVKLLKHSTTSQIPPP